MENKAGEIEGTPSRISYGDPSSARQASKATRLFQSKHNNNQGTFCSQEKTIKHHDIN